MSKRFNQPERRRFFDPQFILRERRRENRSHLVTIACILLFFFFFDHCVIGAGRVIDVSMLPTLRQGRYLFIHKWIYHFSKPRRGDIVALRPPHDHSLYVKRIVGESGDTLAVQFGRVTINGQPLEEPYARGETYPMMGPTRIPEGSYFVLGDNRVNSEDSRHFGPVPRTRIVGKI